MKGGLGNLMKQAQVMQEKLKKAQDELAQTEVTGESGGGMVKVTMTGKHHVVRILIEAGLLKDDKDMLEDLLAAAFNDAVKKIEVVSKEKFSGMAGGINIPGLNLPF